MSVKDIECHKCGKALGTIQKARIIKGIAFLCPDHAVADPEALRKAAEAFGKNHRPASDMDFGDILKKMGL